MEQTTPSATSEPSTPPSSAAEQARIRKERREAKIRSGASMRLNKITGLGGGIQRDPPSEAAVSGPAPPRTADPDEVDISQHFYQPASAGRPRPAQQPDGQISDDQLRAMMLGFPPHGSSDAASAGPLPPPGSNPFAGFPGMDGMSPGMGPGDAADPMLKLLQQMMGGAAGEGPNGMPSFTGVPPMGMPGQEVPGTAAADPSTSLWRILHAVFALALGFYIAFTAEFNGTELERKFSSLTTGNGSGWVQRNILFFYIFATAEILLQTSRFILEKGTLQPTGILGMVTGFLPQRWKDNVALMLRYWRIWSTISEDAMVCIFVLGVCSWLRSA